MPSTKKIETSCHPTAIDGGGKTPEPGIPATPTTKQNRNAEDRMLAAFTVWAWNAFPGARRAWWHVPNELARLPGETAGNHRRRLSQAKAKGVVKGVADVHCIWHGRFTVIEFKIAGGVVGDDQRRFMDQVKAQGGAVHEAWTLEEAKAIFESIMYGAWRAKEKGGLI